MKVKCYRNMSILRLVIGSLSIQDLKHWRLSDEEKVLAKNWFQSLDVLNTKQPENKQVPSLPRLTVKICHFLSLLPTCGGIMDASFLYETLEITGTLISWIAFSSQNKEVLLSPLLSVMCGTNIPDITSLEKYSILFSRSKRKALHFACKEVVQ